MTFCTIGASVEAFFTYRVYVVSGHWWLALPLWVLEISVMGVCASLVALASRSGGFLQFKEHYNWLVYLCLITTTVVRAISSLLDARELTAKV
jgi:hypothetical protein